LARETARLSCDRDEALNTNPDDIIAAYQQLIEKAHTHGVKIFGCTLMPFEGAVYYRENRNKARLAVNQWTRTSGAFDEYLSRHQNRISQQHDRSSNSRGHHFRERKKNQCV
jgi:hypothetical protein